MIGVCVCVCRCEGNIQDVLWPQSRGHLSHTYARHVTGDKQLTHTRPRSCARVCCFIRLTDPRPIVLHSNMLMYLCSALIGPSDARPAPPVFMGSLQSVLQSGPRHCVRARSADIMQTNTSLLFGTSCADPPLRKKREKVSKGKRRKEWWVGEGGCLNSLVWLPEVCYFTGGNLPARFIPSKLQPVR